MTNIVNEKKMAFLPDRLKTWSTVHQRILKNKMPMPAPIMNPQVIDHWPYRTNKRVISDENSSEVL